MESFFIDQEDQFNHKDCLETSKRNSKWGMMALVSPQLLTRDCILWRLCLENLPFLQDHMTYQKYGSLTPSLGPVYENDIAQHSNLHM